MGTGRGHQGAINALLWRRISKCMLQAQRSVRKCACPCVSRTASSGTSQPMPSIKSCGHVLAEEGDRGARLLRTKQVDGR
eukprot:1617205-Alexandrium_andersonii.AAC.1